MLGSLVFLLLAPGVVAGAVPWWLTGWDVQGSGVAWALGHAVGALLTLAGVGVLLRSFVRFALEGVGTPAPVAPTETLVVGGAYGYVRNPMYVAVLAAVAGQALLFGHAVLLAYAAVLALAFVTFVRLYEEPTLRTRHGATYEAYRRAVPGWWPRRHRWTPGPPAS